MNQVLIIAGPTGVGKSKVAIELAKKINGAVVSCDSVQIYKYFDIGSGKVLPDQREGIDHYFIDCLDPQERYSVAEYSRDVRKCIDKLHQENIIPIVCGGTGLYIHSLIYNLDFSSQPPNPKIRKKYEKLLKEKGVDYLFHELEKLDPEAAKDMDPKNHRRIIRAIEIALQGGKKTKGKFRVPNTDYEFKYFVLHRDRQALYDRINKRVLKMVDQGLFEEAESLYDEYGDVYPMSTIGYKEVVKYLKGDYTKEEAIDKIQQYSRNYAKRQITWFKREPEAIFLNVDDLTLKETRDKILKDIGAYSE